MASPQNSTLLQLPHELLLKVLRHAVRVTGRVPRVSFRDYLNLILTCKDLHTLLEDDRTVFKHNNFHFNHPWNLEHFLQALPIVGRAHIRFLTAIVNYNDLGLGLFPTTIAVLNTCTITRFRIGMGRQYLTALVDPAVLAPFVNPPDWNDPGASVGAYKEFKDDVIDKIRQLSGVEHVEFFYLESTLLDVVIAYYGDDGKEEERMLKSLEEANESFRIALPLVRVSCKCVHDEEAVRKREVLAARRTELEVAVKKDKKTVEDGV